MPEDLRVSLGRREVWRSLRTDSLTVARRRAPRVAATIEHDFEIARVRAGLSNGDQLPRTLIAVRDTSCATVQPISRPEAAPRVMTIIDGQQRITTSVMIDIALHAQLTSTLAKLGAVAGDEFD